MNSIPCGKTTGRRTYFGRSTSSRLLPARPKGTLAKARTGRKNADGLLGDAHDAADGLLFHAHFVENEEEKLSQAA